MRDANEPVRAGDVLTRAAALVAGDREATHGSKVENFAAIAAVWNGILEARRINGLSGPLNGHDVANLMEGMKIARRYSGSFNPDDYIDGAGYAGVAYEVERSRLDGWRDDWRKDQEKKPPVATYLAE
ncbi:DUF6378 domain-containing protein [uncultured Alsobacter sp.]|uniref:DUF6378 domain-containing protein n=1 Tax=uncultured Alsobacter sp. TaxID=1748258 RepID=UPI0025D57E01|nr:DUF6378 domain-containing protein [uncultured Alsobacter sp.]